MRKFFIIGLLVLFTASIAAISYAGETGASSKKNGWQTIYDDMSGWSWGKSSDSAAASKEKTVSPKETDKKGTEVSVKK
ncbi:MAG: hypothetical protein ABH883_02340 [Candidatus Omnitrophota bacterium]